VLSRFLNKSKLLFAAMLAILIVVLLLWPAELTDEQLMQVKPGMKLLQVEKILGEPNESLKAMILGYCFTPTSHMSRSSRLFDDRWLWRRPGKLWVSTLTVHFPCGFKNAPNSSAYYWIGKKSILWVNHEQGMVVTALVVPIERSGGGLQGCFDTVRDYWNN
jgi:hypothetical protein